MQKQGIKLIVVCILNAVRFSHPEVFTSSLKMCHALKVELDRLVYYEDKLMKDEENEKNYDLIQKIRRELPKYYFNQPEYPFDDCLDDYSQISRFITHPVNAYKLIYRSVHFWSEIKDNDPSIMFQKFYRYKYIYNISKTDLDGARVAMHRLRTYYALKPQHIRDGIFSREWKSTSDYWTIVPQPLTPEDMFEIGKVAFKIADHESAKFWFNTAHQDVINSKSKVNLELVLEILDYLAWSE
ncbi:Prolyl 4-hydroxylase subunit alpha-1 [Thelohanellus kitauei]|uniref:Prolyl 4-hydroxylase subunit alpha-1 n=1 Tax=Thelohanellus kitauei TaxID=669202 RepID=A0A0C2JCE3_THEKT|nr:Prolyl 4-hydroxylase subunit alpha-1 [Thelohanellus kitauei]